MQSNIRVISLLGLCFALAASVSAASREKSADAAAVEKVLAGIVAADNAADLDAVVSHYTEDAILLPPNDVPVVGKLAIRARYEEAFRHFRFDIAFVSDESQLFGDWAFVRGVIRGRTIPKDETSGRTLNDKFVMILHREKDGWKIARLIWNGSDPVQQHS